MTTTNPDDITYADTLGCLPYILGFLLALAVIAVAVVRSCVQAPLSVSPASEVGVKAE